MNCDISAVMYRKNVKMLIFVLEYVIFSHNSVKKLAGKSKVSYFR